MHMRLIAASTLLVAAPALAGVQFYSGSQIQSPVGTAIIDGNSPSGQAYSEAGLNFSINASGFSVLSMQNGTLGLYINGGGSTMNRIVRADGQDFGAIEMELSDGWGGNHPPYLWALAYLDGQLVGDFAYDATRGEVVGMSGTFDEVRVQSYVDAATRDTARNQQNQNAYGAIAIDNITYANIPAPGAAALAGLGGLVAARRRRA